MDQACKTGDLFAIDLADGVALGQVFYADNISLYVGVFGERFPSDAIDGNMIANLEPLFAHETLDALFFHKRWRIVGNYDENLDRVCAPRYRVGFKSHMYLETLDRKLIRELNESEEKLLRYRKVVAPIRIDKAVKAHFGEGEWDLSYDDLKYECVLKSMAVSL